MFVPCGSLRAERIAGLSRSMVRLAWVRLRSVFEETTARFVFAGGTNITLCGSTDPKWGWIDGKGQAVRTLSSV